MIMTLIMKKIILNERNLQIYNMDLKSIWCIKINAHIYVSGVQKGLTDFKWIFLILYYY